MTVNLDEYRPNVGVVLVNKEGLIWVGERANIAGAWQMPQGGMEEGDSVKETAYKELTEETGIKARDVTYVTETEEWLCYDFPKGAIPKEDRGEIWKGQKQKWVLFYYKGKPNAIDLHKATDKEFSRWKWNNPASVLAEAVDFRKPIYEKVFATFKEHIKRS